MKSKIIFSILIMCIIYACKKKEQNKDTQSQKTESSSSSLSPDSVITKQWRAFLDVAISGDSLEIKDFLNQTIRCYLCLENTPSEQKKLSLLRETDATWYEKIYNEKIYIPLDTFLAKDFNLIFNNDFLKILKESTTDFHKVENDSTYYYEVLVTTTAPTIAHEGGQHSFQFKKVEGNWKLSEIGTIP